MAGGVSTSRSQHHFQLKGAATFTDLIGTRMVDWEAAPPLTCIIQACYLLRDHTLHLVAHRARTISQIPRVTMRAPIPAKQSQAMVLTTLLPEVGWGLTCSMAFWASPALSHLYRLANAVFAPRMILRSRHLALPGIVHAIAFAVWRSAACHSHADVHMSGQS